MATRSEALFKFNPNGFLQRRTATRSSLDANSSLSQQMLCIIYETYIVTRRRIEFCRYDLPTTVAAGPVTGEAKTSFRGNEYPQRCVCPEPSSRRGDAGNT